MKTKETLDHLASQFWLSLETNRLRDTDSLTPIRVFYPVEGQIQLTVNEGMPLGSHIREKDSHLTVLYLTRSSAILQAHPRRFLSSLGKAGFINGQDGRRAAQLLDGVRTQVIADPMRVPNRIGEQSLHPIGASFPCLFRQLPAVFAGRVAQNPLQVSQYTTPWFGTGKAWGKTGVQTTKALDPPTDIRGGRLGSSKSGLVVWFHLLLLRDGTFHVQGFPYRLPHLEEKDGPFFNTFSGSYSCANKCDCSVNERHAWRKTGEISRRKAREGELFCLCDRLGSEHHDVRAMRRERVYAGRVWPLEAEPVGKSRVELYE